MKPKASVKVETELGVLTCEAHTDPSYPGLTVYWNGRQIAVIEAAKPVMRVMVWDTDADDPSSTLPVFPGYGE